MTALLLRLHCLWKPLANLWVCQAAVVVGWVIMCRAMSRHNQQGRSPENVSAQQVLHHAEVHDAMSCPNSMQLVCRGMPSEKELNRTAWQ